MLPLPDAFLKFVPFKLDPLIKPPQETATPDLPAGDEIRSQSPIQNSESSILAALTLVLLEATGTGMGLDSPLMDAGIDSISAPAFARNLG